MKSFSFKVLYFSIFAPSILYVLTLPYLELWIQNDLSKVLRQSLIQNQFDLLQGKISLYEEINRNVNDTLIKHYAIQYGADVNVRIIDGDENVIYPYYEHLLLSFQSDPSQIKTRTELFDERGYAVNASDEELETVLQEYSDYFQKLRIVVGANIPVTSWLGSGALLIYILLTILTLYLYYQRSRRIEEMSLQEIQEKLETEKRSATEKVEHQLQEAQSRLSEIHRQEEEWLLEVERLQKEKALLEDELLDTLEQTEEQKEQIDKLEDEVIKKSEKKPKAVKEAQSLQERFARLYKNLEFDRKVLEDIVRLKDEKMKLQAEEMLKRLNDSDPGLKIRRKISGVEKCDAYELSYGASGRIYYIQSQTKRYKVLRVGTKASQRKDLAYLQGRSKS